MPTLAQIEAELSIEDLPWIEEELARRERAESMLLSGPAYFGNSLLGNNFVIAPHIKFINDFIAKRIERGNARIIVAAPPRHGKSILLSQMTPAWFLNRWPNRRVIIAAHTASFAATWGRKIRDMVVEHHDKLSFKIKGGLDAAKAEWVTNKKGEFRTSGVDGPILGRGADLLIIDDPTKDSNDAYSPLHQESLRDWYQSTAGSRLEPGASVIVTMQRWPSCDFVSWLIEQGKEGREEWDLISLPAIAEADDQLGRKIGEALWPERYDVEALERKRLSLEDVALWRSQWQQAPPEASTEGLAYHAFSAVHSVRDVAYRPSLPIAWSLDFNVDPMCSVIAQVEKTFEAARIEPNGKTIHVLDEIFLPNSNTQAAVKEFVARVDKMVPDGRRVEVEIYGDASGNSRKTTGATDYKVIDEMLKQYGQRFTVSFSKTMKSDQGVRERITTVNNAFLNASGERRLFVNSKCVELKKDYGYMRWKRDVAGNPTNDLDKSNPMRSHISDAVQYLVWGELKLTQKSGGFRNDFVF